MSSVNLNNLFGYNTYSYSSSTQASPSDYPSLSKLYSGNYAKNTAATSTDTQKYLSSIKQSSNNLKQSADKMLIGFPPVFQHMIAVSDKAEALEVESNKNKTTPSKSDTDVSIDQVATTQQNTSTTQTANEANKANKGNNQFTIASGNKSTTLRVKVAEGDTNQQVQQKMADAINKSNAGLTAKVQYDSKKNESTLVLESKTTGGKNNFTISDSGDGNLVATTGADKVSREAQDAKFSIDGVAKSSSTNTVQLGNGVTGTLKAASTHIKVGVKQDVDGIASAITDLASNYNSLLQSANQNGTVKGAQNIAKQLTSTFKTYSASLSKIGITADQNNNLVIDSDKLKSSISNGTAERALGIAGKNANYGFVPRLQQIARNVDSNPTQYLAKTDSKTSATNSSYLNSKASGLGFLYDSIV